MTTIKECIVHNRKYLSKFHANINQLRQTNQFNISILQKLPKRCCSCHENNGESTFDLNNLHKLCQEIQSSEKSITIIKSKPVKPINYVILDFPSDLSHIQRISKAGRFIGRRGQHIRLIEKTFDISIQIINSKSKKHLRDIIDQLKQENKDISSDALWILINMKNNKDNIQQIKQYLQDQWKKIDVTRRNTQTRKIQINKDIISSLIDTFRDTRWKPKKQTLKDKIKQKQKQFDQQEEVQPQPLVRPLSMPKEISKSQKIKQK